MSDMCENMIKKIETYKQEALLPLVIVTCALSFVFPIISPIVIMGGTIYFSQKYTKRLAESDSSESYGRCIAIILVGIILICSIMTGGIIILGIMAFLCWSKIQAIKQRKDMYKGLTILLANLSILFIGCYIAVGSSNLFCYLIQSMTRRHVNETEYLMLAALLSMAVSIGTLCYNIYRSKEMRATWPFFSVLLTLGLIFVIKYLLNSNNNSSDSHIDIDSSISSSTDLSTVVTDGAIASVGMCPDISLDAIDSSPAMTITDNAPASVIPSNVIESAAEPDIINNINIQTFDAAMNPSDSVTINEDGTGAIFNNIGIQTGNINTDTMGNIVASDMQGNAIASIDQTGFINDGNGNPVAQAMSSGGVTTVRDLETGEITVNNNGFVTGSNGQIIKNIKKIDKF